MNLMRSQRELAFNHNKEGRQTHVDAKSFFDEDY